MIVPQKGSAQRSASGLTLIELVLTLSILAVAGVLVSGALATGLGAWQAGFTRGRDELVARVVIERIAAQLRAVVAAKARQGQREAVAFDAQEHALRFVTCAGAGAAPMQVSYSLAEGSDGAHLLYREYPWPDKEFFGKHEARREEALPEVAGFSVSVVKRPDEETEGGAAAEPQEKWSPLDQLLPKSVTVEIALRERGGEAQVHKVVVTLPSELVP